MNILTEPRPRECRDMAYFRRNFVAMARGAIPYVRQTETSRGRRRQAAMEDRGYGLLENFECMRSGLDMTFPLVPSEGGASSPLWRQIVADMLDVECVYAPLSKGAPVGDAVIAGVGAGIYKDYGVAKDWLELGERTSPIAENHVRYRKFYAIYRALYPAIEGQFARLADALVS